MGRPDEEHQWVKRQDPKIKQRILDYNEDDCVALRCDAGAVGCHERDASENRVVSDWDLIQL